MEDKWALQDDEGRLTLLGRRVLWTVAILVLLGVSLELWRTSRATGDEANETTTTAFEVTLSSRAERDDAEVISGETVLIDVLDNDTLRAGAELTAAYALDGSEGDFEVQDGRVAFSSLPGQLGASNGEYVITDDTGTSRALVSVRVVRDPDGPTALDDGAFTSIGETVTVDVLDNDTTNDGVIDITEVEASTNGDATINADGSISFTLSQGDTGSATYRVVDGEGRADTADLLIRRRPDPGVAIWLLGDRPPEGAPLTHRFPIPRVYGLFTSAVEQPTDVAVGPDGQIVIVGGGREKDGERQERLGPDVPRTEILDADVDDVDYIAISDTGGATFRFADLPNPEMAPTSVAIAPDGRIAVGGERGALVILDGVSLEVIAEIRRGIDPFLDLAEVEFIDDGGATTTSTTVPEGGVPFEPPDGGENNDFRAWYGIHDVEFGPDGALYWVDFDRGQVLRWIDGEETVVAGSNEGAYDAPSGSVLLQQARGLAIAEDGTIWVGHIHGITRISGGQGTLEAARSSFLRARPSVAEISPLGRVGDVILGPDGLLYFVDTAEHQLWIYDPASNQARRLLVEGDDINNTSQRVGTLEGLNVPTGLAFDKDGNLFVADRDNDRVLMIGDPSRSRSAGRSNQQAADPAQDPADEG